MVFSDAITVFSLSSYSDFCILQSSVYEMFAWKYGSKMGASTLRFTPKSTFEPFPKPDTPDSSSTENIGAIYYDFRKQVMEREKYGLTEFYNRFHDSKNTDESILKLRELHKKVDAAVVSAYGWDDLKLEHHFHDVDYLSGNDRVRFTISENARNEILDRLTLLNKQRFDEEQEEAGSLHSLPNKKYKKIKASQALDKVAKSKPQMSFFEDA